MADKGQEGSEKVEFETLMAAYPSVMYKIVVRIAQSVLAEAFPQSQNPETRADHCMDAVEGVPIHAGPGVLFVVDPPYSETQVNI